jgi:hypothetical protein
MRFKIMAEIDRGLMSFSHGNQLLQGIYFIKRCDTSLLFTWSIDDFVLQHGEFVTYLEAENI